MTIFYPLTTLKVVELLKYNQAILERFTTYFLSEREREKEVGEVVSDTTLRGGGSKLDHRF
jgi:hypothetical protein